MPLPTARGCVQKLLLATAAGLGQQQQLPCTNPSCSLHTDTRPCFSAYFSGESCTYSISKNSFRNCFKGQNQKFCYILLKICLEQSVPQLFIVNHDLLWKNISSITKYINLVVLSLHKYFCNLAHMLKRPLSLPSQYRTRNLKPSLMKNITVYMYLYW